MSPDPNSKFDEFGRIITDLNMPRLPFSAGHNLPPAEGIGGAPGMAENKPALPMITLGRFAPRQPFNPPPYVAPITPAHDYPTPRKSWLRRILELLVTLALFAAATASAAYIIFVVLPAAGWR